MRRVKVQKLSWFKCASTVLLFCGSLLFHLVCIFNIVGIQIQIKRNYTKPIIKTRAVCHIFLFLKCAVNLKICSSMQHLLGWLPLYFLLDLFCWNIAATIFFTQWIKSQKDLKCSITFHQQQYISDSKPPSVGHSDDMQRMWTS